MSGKINIMKAKEIKINIKEKFKHLSKAPIVEAIIEFQTDFYEEWKTDAIKEFLIKQLPKYPIIKTEKKVTPSGKVFITAGFNNTLITITDPEGNALFSG